MSGYFTHELDHIDELGRPVFRPIAHPSECGHDQHRPTGVEIDGCPEIIVRECATCRAPLWWNVDGWRLV